jgi:hypothetical protein
MVSGGIVGSTAAPPVAAAITLTGFIGLPTVPIPTVGLGRFALIYSC